MEISYLSTSRTVLYLTVEHSRVVMVTSYYA